ncbi:transcriptional regulator, XRE family [[Leptolyngbya] sp. PCC 7376]|uniref:hypothetical protein n=1 Tax=[Leptolyngbya] sp. PCC 7376 TaxID=111781 RepID=UPI00029F240F|nr:hypothetical protein [[Leptolyngbya] sp. PCC 7376]AFY36917.1 transcriptional regulator, XRE family [[Leptolyngbya] sp. PCC 7376]
MSELNRSNFASTMAQFLKTDQKKPTFKDLAYVIGCSEATISRLLSAVTYPSDDMLKQGAILITLGHNKYSKLSNSEKEKISEAIGAVGGGAVGMGAITGAISVLGSVAGLSAAGITSGLATLGGLIGGGMVAGVMVAAAFPIAAGAAGLGVVAGIKHLATEYQVQQTDIDPRWELIMNDAS